MPATYRSRLRVEGAVLAAAGLAGSAVLLRGPEQARRWPWNTVGQLALTAAGLYATGRKATTDAMADAAPVAAQDAAGEPTPLWHVPVPMLAFGAVVGPLGGKVARPPKLAEKAGWDATLRVTGGSAIVGLFQWLVLARLVGAEERRTGRRFVRVPGSRIGKTKLGYLA